MHFETSVTGARFDIPDEWWSFAEMDTFKRVSEYYPPPRDKDFELVPLSDVEPPMRNLGVPPFKKYKLLPVLFTFWSPECALPPVEVSPPRNRRPLPLQSLQRVSPLLRIGGSRLHQAPDHPASLMTPRPCQSALNMTP
jgi:hypothetical protein